ncbi:MAG: hypothetical protein J6M25_03485 [Prevotella sp.]|nr:hypothetical protein [Prevotella sp.]
MQTHTDHTEAWQPRLAALLRDAGCHAAGATRRRVAVISLSSGQYLMPRVT